MPQFLMMGDLVQHQTPATSLSLTVPAMPPHSHHALLMIYAFLSAPTHWPLDATVCVPIFLIL